MPHVPVLQQEVIHYLDPKPNENFVDCTFGFAGHAKAILEKNGPGGRVLGIEIDADIYEKIKEENIKRLILVNDSYVNLKKIVQQCNFKPIDGILFDLGLSSWHLEKSGRGFTFQKDEPLDMRYNREIQNSKFPEGLPRYRSGPYGAGKVQNNLTAEGIVNRWSENEIEKLLKEYGEEKFAERIAKEIIVQRKKNPIKTTLQLVELIKKAIPKKFQNYKIHPATRAFQALRIVVNKELDNLSRVLSETVEVLEPGGRIVIISFHSLEDRLVKNFLKQEKQKESLRLLTKKPICSSAAQVQQNPRSRSAKLRAALKITNY